MTWISRTSKILNRSSYCIYVYVYVCMCTWYLGVLCGYVYESIYVFVCTFCVYYVDIGMIIIYIYVYVCVYMCIYIYIYAMCMYVVIYLYMSLYIYAWVWVCEYYICINMSGVGGGEFSLDIPAYDGKFSTVSIFDFFGRISNWKYNIIFLERYMYICSCVYLYLSVWTVDTIYG